VSDLALVGALFHKECAGGDNTLYLNNCAHFLSDAFIRAGYEDLRNYGARCNTPARRPIRAREMWAWFQTQAIAESATPTRGTGWWAIFQLDESEYWGGHVVVLNSDSWWSYGTGWYGSWTQYMYQW
jgi:hypothetical protein